MKNENQLDPLHIVRDDGGHRGDELLQALMHLWESRHCLTFAVLRLPTPGCSQIEQKGKEVFIFFLDTSAQYVFKSIYIFQ